MWSKSDHVDTKIPLSQTSPELTDVTPLRPYPRDTTPKLIRLNPSTGMETTHRKSPIWEEKSVQTNTTPI